MEEEKNKSAQNLGIAALITAIITFVLAVIPCVGFIAIIPGIIAIVLASVGLSQSTGSDSPRGVLIAGLIIAIIASMISFSQIFVVGKIFDKAEKWPGKIEEIVDEVKSNVLKDLEDANISIKVENGGEKVEITTGSDKQDKEKTLEELKREAHPRMILWSGNSNHGSISQLRLQNEPYLVINIVFTIVILIIITYSGIFSPEKDNYPVTCIHEKLTGGTCASCGVSHSFSLIMRGRIEEAFRYNKNGMKVFIFFVSQLLMRIFFSIFYINHPVTRKQLILLDITGSSLIFLIAFCPFIIFIFRWL